MPARPRYGAGMSVRPSGEQFEIRSGPHVATVVEVGGGIRAYDVAGRQVLHPYDADAMPDAAHGAVLIPWPNRLADGRYRFAGRDHQLALTEPTKHNAIHGLLRWRPWRNKEHQPDRIVMTARLLPMTGYPFALEVEVDYSVSDDGLVVTTAATNIGDQACPYAAGQHPYLSPGDGLIDACTLTLPAATESPLTRNASCRAGESRSTGRRTTSAPDESSVTSRSTSPSPTWCEALMAMRRWSWVATMGVRRSCGRTRATR